MSKLGHLETAVLIAEYDAHRPRADRAWQRIGLPERPGDELVGDAERAALGKDWNHGVNLYQELARRATALAGRPIVGAENAITILGGRA